MAASRIGFKPDDARQIRIVLAPWPDLFENVERLIRAYDARATWSQERFQKAVRDSRKRDTATLRRIADAARKLRERVEAASNLTLTEGEAGLPKRRIASWEATFMEAERTHVVETEGRMLDPCGAEPAVVGWLKDWSREIRERERTLAALRQEHAKSRISEGHPKDTVGRVALFDAIESAFLAAGAPVRGYDGPRAPFALTVHATLRAINERGAGRILRRYTNTSAR
jgi:hypothetical protein